MNGGPPRITWTTFKRLLLGFWAVLLSIVFATNACDGLKTLGLLPPTFWFASGNYGAVAQVVQTAQPPAALTAALFTGVVFWELASAALFWQAAFRFRGSHGGGGTALLPAFTVGLGLWGAFMIACELFPSLLAYQIAASHRALFTMQLLTLSAVVLLPDDDA